jgi:hypothetical protein
MSELLQILIDTFFSTLLDVTPIVLLIAFFQIVIFKKPIPNIKKVLLGVVFVIIGLTFFLMGLEKALFPVGQIMATQLSAPDFISQRFTGDMSWLNYYWVYLFSFLIGFSTTIAEPSLIAVAIKANEVSGGIINKRDLRLIVALGAGIALTLGSYRIVVGDSLTVYLLACYIIVILQTIFAPKDIIALAYDSGGVTTSTVTVPIVAALGLGLSTVIPGRNPAMDGFGLIALVCMFPIITVMGYAQIINIIIKFKKNKSV